jgi:GTP1/Obg family GTP-binding protein
MSVVDDSRKLLQDLIAPELRTIDARLTALEKRFDETDRRLITADKVEQERFAAAEKIAQERFERILSEIRQLHTVHDLELRMAKIEALAGLSRPATSEAA